MGHRVSTSQIFALMSGGSVRATAASLYAYASAPAITRVTTAQLGAYAVDKTLGIHVTTAQFNLWTSVDQGLYLTGPVFGSNEVFTPDVTSIFVPETPTAPVVEVNPFRADVPNVDQQRILREQHNLTQAGDSTFHWGVLTEISATPLYNLGSVGRFYHDEFGISIARYVKFTSMVKTAAKAVPVGLNRKLNQHWTVTNQLELSDKNSVMGIACPYNELVYSGSWYGWVIVDGFVPAELDVVLGDSIFEWATEYTWGETGKVVPNGEGDLIGIRFTTSNVPNLKPGELLVKVNDWSLAKLTGLITTSLGPVGEQLNELTSEVNALTATSTTHTQQIGQLQSQVVGLDNRITKESEATARQLAAIRSLMPNVDFKSYVDSQVEMLTIKIDTQDGIIGEIANNALAKVNELELKFEAISNQSLQVQIDSINDALGALTGRLVGFTTQIDTTTLTAGQVLISTDAGLTPGGTQLYDFQPIDFKFENLLDVDVTTPPTTGQVPIWDNTASKWIPGDQSGGGGGGGGGAPWELFAHVPITSPVSEVEVKDLDGAQDILILGRNITLSASNWRQVQLSTDNGATYYTSSSDYSIVANTGAESGNAGALGHATSSSAARTIMGIIYAANTEGSPKVVADLHQSESRLFVGSEDPVNAIRINASGGQNLTGGDVYVFIRPSQNVETAQGWELAAMWDYSVDGAVANLDVDVSEYQDIIVECFGVSMSASDWRVCRFSLDGGSTYVDSSDYRSVGSTGTLTNTDAYAFMHASANSGARYCQLYMKGLRVDSAPKPYETTRDSGLGLLGSAANDTLGPVTHVRVFGPNGANFNGGQIFVLGRKG